MKIGRIERITKSGPQTIYDADTATEAEPATAPSAADWPDPDALGDELPPVSAFDLDLLPPSLKPLVADVSERMQVPADFAAIASIVSLAGCVNRRARIYPKVQDTGWEVIPNLWGAIVAPPGYMKSPVLRAVTSPLTAIEKEWRGTYQSEVSKFELESEQAKLRRQAWREKYKAAIKDETPAPQAPAENLVMPKQRRLLVTDATTEKLHLILSENPAGVLVLRDELTGWLGELEREGCESERGFFLQAWNGDAPFTMDRIERGSIPVEAVCVSLLGLIQPTRLRAYLAEVLENGPADDGLFQRFQLLIWPDAPRGWKLVDRPPDASAIESARTMYSALVRLSAENPLRLHFASDAQQLFFDWWAELEKKVRGDCFAHALIAHLSKYRSLMPTLAGLFELADRVGRDGLSGGISISLDHAKQAAAICEYLECHARRVYSCVVSPEVHSAHTLARAIQRGEIDGTFTAREVYRKGWSGLDTPDRARAALAMLEDMGWVRRLAVEKSPAGGRPTEMWKINPKVRREK
jgi:hypothetical protein